MATASTTNASSWWQARQHQWQAWPSAQKWRTLTLIGAAIALSIVGLRVMNAPHWTPVYTQVTPASAGAMSRILKSQQIPYTLGAGGTSLLVPSADVNQARVDLAEHGLPATNTATLPKAPKFSLGETNSEVTAVQQTQLEDALDTTIASIAGITSANVLITQPPPALFGESGTHATASVFVTVAPNTTLSRAQVTGIQHLVAAAVNGLTPGNVAVINQAGTWLSDPHAPVSHVVNASGVVQSQLAATNAVDESMTSHVLGVLEPMFGPGNVVAHVQAHLNFTATSTHTTRYAAKGTPTAQQIQTSSSVTKKGAVVNQGAGVATNTPTYPTGILATAGPKTSKSSNTITHYDVGSTTQTVSNPGGTITGLTVAVAVNHRLTPAAVRQVQALVRQSVGLPAGLAGNITVTTLPFNHHAAQVASKAEAAASIAAARQLRRLEEMAAGAFVALLLVLLILFRRRKPRPVVEEPAAVSDPMTFTDDGAEETSDTLVSLRTHLRTLADDHPDALAKVIQTYTDAEAEG